MVGVVNGWVGAVLGNPGVFLVQARTPVRDMFRVRRVDRPNELVDVELLVHVDDRVRLGRRERRFGNPCAQDVVVQAIVHHAVVEVPVKSADFQFRRERLAHRRPGVRRDEDVAGRHRIGGEAIPVAVEFREQLLDVRRRRRVAAVAAARRKCVQLATVIGAIDGVLVGDAVLVDVAHVIRMEVFLREDGFEHSRRISLKILLVFGKLDGLLSVGDVHALGLDGREEVQQ